MQIPLLAIQAEYADRPNLLPQASGLISFAQLAGAAIGLGGELKLFPVYSRLYSDVVSLLIHSRQHRTIRVP